MDRNLLRGQIRENAAELVGFHSAYGNIEVK